MSEETTVGPITVKNESILKRATMAVVISAVLVIVGVGYLAYTKNTDGILFLVGAGIGYLFKENNNK